MRLSLLFVFLLVVMIAFARAENCRGKQRDNIGFQCRGGKNEGRGGRGCSRNANRRMWYYNRVSGRCEPMRYLGCGGNNNRYCSKIRCENRCIRRN
ncbi:kunitz-type protease inhibitor 3-like [Teleopsis dalmanni]|uniref:kunitz-type protease inhibitor 3-like n=1 Tax=Teleopsis dalmanni TaxID=139649 RepID=UPI0018CF3CE1|nr:kunitz-type protease inhibitor 3-like [Teleopsis dalmanni]